MRRTLALMLLLLGTSDLHAQESARGVKLFQSGDWARSKAEFTAAVQRNDRDALAHYYLGRLALIDNDVDTALPQLERAVKLDDGVADYHLWLGKAVGQQAMRTMQPLLAGRMKSELERAVALDAKSIDARDALVDVYSMAPAMFGGDPDKAREQAQSIAAIDAMRGHLALGRIAMRANDGPTAEREMNAAIAAAPDSLRGYSALGSWYVRQKDWTQAFASLDRYVLKHPDDPYGAYGIGRIAAASGEQLERGEKALRAFIAKPPKAAAPPTLSRAYVLLGQVLEHEAKPADAHAAFEQALKLDRHNEDAIKALK